MTFEKSTKPITISDGYYVNVVFTIAHDIDVSNRIGPLSESAAKLLCRFLIRVSGGINKRLITDAHVAELSIWEDGVSDENIENLFGSDNKPLIIASDIELYKDESIADEIERAQFEWANDYDCKGTELYAEFKSYGVTYADNGKTYNVSTRVDDTDLY